MRTICIDIDFICTPHLGGGEIRLLLPFCFSSSPHQRIRVPCKWESGLQDPAAALSVGGCGDGVITTIIQNNFHQLGN